MPAYIANVIGEGVLDHEIPVKARAPERHGETRIVVLYGEQDGATVALEARDEDDAVAILQEEFGRRTVDDIGEARGQDETRALIESLCGPRPTGGRQSALALVEAESPLPLDTVKGALDRLGRTHLIVLRGGAGGDIYLTDEKVTLLLGVLEVGGDGPEGAAEVAAEVAALLSSAVVAEGS